jgi:hypothetical protein
MLQFWAHDVEPIRHLLIHVWLIPLPVYRLQSLGYNVWLTLIEPLGLVSIGRVKIMIYSGDSNGGGWLTGNYPRKEQYNLTRTG